MKNLKNGHHLYQLENFENKESFQVLQFIEKEPKFGGSPDLITIADGTTNEEVLKMLIHRTRALGEKFPSRENSLALTKMEEALMWFEKRTANRKERGVEGKALA